MGGRGSRRWPRRGSSGRAARPRWTCGLPAAASTSAGAASTTLPPTWRPWSCWPARSPARASASRCSCCSPRWSCGGAARSLRCGTSRRGSRWPRRAPTTSGRSRRWCGTAPAPGPTSPPPGASGRRRRRPTGCATTRAELHRRGSDTVPAVRGVIEAFHLMCTAEIGRAEDATDPDAWERAADTWERYGQPYPAAYARHAPGRGAADPALPEHARGRRPTTGRGPGPHPRRPPASGRHRRSRGPRPDHPRGPRRAAPRGGPEPGRARRAHRARAGGAARAGQRPHQPGDRRSGSTSARRP